MKFYEVFSHDDAGGSDVFFPTKKQAEDYIKQTYEEGEYVLRVLDHKGPLTRAAVCRMLTDWPQR